MKGEVFDLALFKPELKQLGVLCCWDWGGATWEEGGPEDGGNGVVAESSLSSGAT